ncbi:MAG TPA: FGGY family carbohydrate kinase, partial [Phycisphaerae bacterium]|nr:FGGY family carbohydrate kinase [Phycisphaerae bacterium]
MSREKAIVLGVDLGTSRFKAAVFDRHGTQRGLGRRDVAPDRGDGRCELPVDRFWRTLGEAIGEAMTRAAANAGDLEAVAYASQANSFLLLDETCRPLTPILLWPDRRVPQPPPAMRALWARPDFRAVTGVGAEAGTEFAAAKILWFQDRQPRLWRESRYVMTLSDYLVHSLTGRRVGDAGTASLLGMLDVRNLAWWPEAMELLRLDADRLSQPLRPGSVAGTIT